MVKSVFTVQWLTTANWIFGRDYGKVIIIKHSSHIKQVGKIFNFIFVFILVSEFIYIQQEYGMELFIKCSAYSDKHFNKMNILVLKYWIKMEVMWQL